MKSDIKVFISSLLFLVMWQIVFTHFDLHGFLSGILYWIFILFYSISLLISGASIIVRYKYGFRVGETFIEGPSSEEKKILKKMGYDIIDIIRPKVELEKGSLEAINNKVKVIYASIQRSPGPIIGVSTNFSHVLTASGRECLMTNLIACWAKRRVLGPGETSIKCEKLGTILLGRTHLNFIFLPPISLVSKNYQKAFVKMQMM